MPHCADGVWSFSFEVEAESTFGISGNHDPFAALCQDCNGVPMLTGLDERSDIDPVLRPNQNIWFETVNN